MGRKAKEQRVSEIAVLRTPEVWLKAEFELPSAFSYRQPDASAQFAIGSPVPSPAAIKLALVDAVIRWSGSVEKGKEVFEWLKTCNVHPVPPEQVVKFRVFLKRLKPRESELLESTGIRDYFLLDGKLTVFLQVPQDKVETTMDLLSKVRRLGTSDSLCWCCNACKVSGDDLPEKLFPVRLDKLPDNLLQQMLVHGFMVARLSDLTEKSEFEGFNPFGGDSRKAHLDKASYLLPLRMERYGETWAVLKRAELPFGE